MSNSKIFEIKNIFLKSAELNKHQIEKGHIKNMATLQVKMYTSMRKYVMFPLSTLVSEEDKEKLNENGLGVIVYNSTMIPVDSLELMAKDKNPKTMPTTEEADTWIEGDEVLYTYPGLQEPIRYPKDLYIKYFWLFYIVALDFWDKYPQHVYFSQGPYTKLRDDDSRARLENFKNRFYSAIREAKQNLPWAQEAEKMVEEKKKEGTYWDELEQVAKECDRLEEEAKENTK